MPTKVDLTGARRTLYGTPPGQVSRVFSPRLELGAVHLSVPTFLVSTDFLAKKEYCAGFGFSTICRCAPVYIANREVRTYSKLEVLQDRNLA